MSKVKLQTSIKTIKNNIQGMDLSSDQSFFIIVSKLQSNITSMYDYYVSVYDTESLQKKNQAYVYSTYKQAKHPCAILSDRKTIVVSTFNHIYFYDQNLTLRHKQAHNQQSIQDMEGSPDSKLLVVVGGNNIILWDPLTYKRFVFQKLSQYSKICKFSKDNSKLGISTGKNLYIYSIPADLTSTLIPSPTVISSQAAKILTQPERKAGISEDEHRQATDSLGSGQISYFDFSPIDSQLIAVSFGNLSPKLYHIQDQKFFSISLNQQPHVVGNAKYLHFMPDGKRVFSSDDKGYALWSGSDKNLTYVQDNRIHQLKAYSAGKKLLGYRWFQIVKIQIKFQCGDKSYSAVCPCQANFYWDLPAQKCLPCQQPNTNICQCKEGQNFIPQLGRCIYNCTAQKNTIKYLSTGIPDLPCICERGYFFRDNQCIFECNKIFELGRDKDKESCVCKPTFVWNNITKQCECSQNSQLVRDSNQDYVCQCLFEYVRDQFDKCVPDCKIKKNAIDQRDQFGNCRCRPGFQFIKYQNISTTFQFNSNYTDKLYFQSTNGDCVRNCSMLNDTIGNVDTERCSCRQYMYWANDLCNINCQKLPNGGSSFVQDGMTSCPCSPPYTWVPQIKECGRSCKEFKYVNTSKFSNSKSCPCIDKFFWTSYGTQSACQIDCKGQVNGSLQNNPADNSSCICRDAFNWNSTSYSCQIDCQKIWDAEKRISSDQCSCKNNKIFNKQKKLCEVTSVEGVFSKPWIWAVLGISVLFVIIVAIVMIKFCWKFSNNSQNKQHNKKLKKRTEPPIRKKRQKKDLLKGASSQRAQIKQ